MNAYYSDLFDFPLPERHRFPKHKYSLLRRRVTEAGLLSSQDLHIPNAVTDDELLLVHSPEYLEKVNTGKLTDKEIRRFGLPWSPQLVERSKRSTGGTIEACKAALNEGIAFNLSGGTHHAFADHAEGFCLLNDIAVAARLLQFENLVQRFIIVDCDVHQGNGTASIFFGDATVFTLSIHGEKNFPLRKEKSDLDIALADNTTDDIYLDALRLGILEAFEYSKPEMVIYVSGADAFVDDQLGRLSLTKTGLAQRDCFIYHQCQKVGLPIAVVMAGGYAKNIDDTVDIHFQTISCAVDLYQ
jgi:acetoin utilization deacetylase AcuC-like enzyme